MSADPYRTLGLQPGASMAEVKRAYRRLAKAFHPDSAGEAALPRFLAIHEAYDAIRAGRPSVGGRATATPAGPAASPGAEPWRADPDRARAARERARTSRGQRAGAAGSGATGRGEGSAGSRGASGRATGSSSTSGSARGASTPGTSRNRGSGRRRETRKATLGSTSYDEARDPADATWSGASWYGPTSGEYWIVNPREYADPRKHGPDYQSRARRPAGSQAADAVPAEPEESATTPADAESGGRPRFETPPAPAGARRREQATAWRGRDGGLDGASIEGEAVAAGGQPGDAGDPIGRARPSIASPRDWLGTSADDPIRRLGLALVAWPPIGLAAAAAIGDVTGCTTYAAACGGTDSILPWLAQAGILGLLLLLPPIARLLAAGTVAVVLALVPVTALLVAVGGTGQREAGFALAFLLGAVWLVGVAWAVVMAGRRISGASAGARP